MSDDQSLPKLSQRAISSLIVLMAAARELTNPELEELAGFRLNGPDRRSLNDLGFVTSRKAGQAYKHELTTEGWRASRRLLAAERPARAGSFGGALYALMAALSAGLDRQGLSPAEFFGDGHAAQARPEPVAEAEKPAQNAVERNDSAGGGDSAGIETAIRTAYTGLAKGDGGWVGLAPLRARLRSYGRTDVDRALRRLATEPGVHIIPVANLKSLTQEDRDAALRLGGEDNHAIAIEAR